jgi:hypothetical protein
MSNSNEFDKFAPSFICVENHESVSISEKWKRVL